MRRFAPNKALFAAVLLLSFALTVACGAPPRRPPRPPRPTVPQPVEPDGDDTTDYRPHDLKPARLSEKMRERCVALDPLIQETAEEFSLDPALILAIVRIESGFKADARSRVGARGLMQLMPRTARGLDCGDVWSPERNLRCGATLLRRYLDRFGGKLLYALAAYNAGPRRVRDEFEKQLLPRNFRYVEKVLKMRSFFLRGGCDAE